MKSPAELTGDEVKRSHPVRGAWIEIGYINVCGHSDSRRTPSGVRGLK